MVNILPQRRSDDADQLQSELHLLSGCSIDHNGVANVASYFTPTIEDATDVASASSVPSAASSAVASTSKLANLNIVGRQTASFRGRLMRGAKVASEAGYKFYVLVNEVEREPEDDEEEDDEDRDEGEGSQATGCDWRIIASADNISYWKHHVPVDPGTDAVYRAMSWVRTADALHSEV